MYINQHRNIDWYKRYLAQKFSRAEKQYNKYKKATENLEKASILLNTLGYKPGMKILHKQFKLCEIVAITVSDSKGTVTMEIKEVKPDSSGYTVRHKVNLSRVSELTEAAKIIYE